MPKQLDLAAQTIQTQFIQFRTATLTDMQAYHKTFDLNTAPDQ